MFGSRHACTATVPSVRNRERRRRRPCCRSSAAVRSRISDLSEMRGDVRQSGEFFCNELPEPANTHTLRETSSASFCNLPSATASLGVGALRASRIAPGNVFVSLYNAGLGGLRVLSVRSRNTHEHLARTHDTFRSNHPPDRTRSAPPARKLGLGRNAPLGNTRTSL